jgi:hypothetical protein
MGVPEQDRGPMRQSRRHAEKIRLYQATSTCYDKFVAAHSEAKAKKLLKSDAVICIDDAKFLATVKKRLGVVFQTASGRRRPREASE